MKKLLARTIDEIVQDTLEAYEDDSLHYREKELLAIRAITNSIQGMICEIVDEMHYFRHQEGISALETLYMVNALFEIGSRASHLMDELMQYKIDKIKADVLDTKQEHTERNVRFTYELASGLDEDQLFLEHGKKQLESLRINVH